jgi:3-hydroxyanthranilate 3,4-dioxygenase
MLDRPRPQAFNFQKWIDDNAHLLKPPVSNQRMFEHADMIVMVVGGPNMRTDFHDDPVEEFFYQLKGDMVLKIAEDGRFYDVPIREGEVFLMPPHLRHSPQRPQEGSIGLVVEPPRPAHDPNDGFEWFCFECGALVHRAELKIRHIVRDLPPIYEAFHNNAAARKCPSCGTIHPGKAPPPGWVKL